MAQPLWFVWEDGAFWWLTGPWAALPRHLDHDPRVAVVVAWFVRREPTSLVAQDLSYRPAPAPAPVPPGG